MDGTTGIATVEAKSVDGIVFPAIVASKVTAEAATTFLNTRLSQLSKCSFLGRRLANSIVSS